MQRNYARAKGAVATKPYTLLRQALSRTDKVAVVKYALRGRERLGLLRSVGEALSIQVSAYGLFSPVAYGPTSPALTAGSSPAGDLG
ncbi:Ku protein [Streptomyces sp. NPDC001919]